MPCGLSLPQAKHKFFFTGCFLLPCPVAELFPGINREFYPITLKPKGLKYYLRRFRSERFEAGAVRSHFPQGDLAKYITEELVRRVLGMRSTMSLVSNAILLITISNFAWAEGSPGAATFKAKCVLCHGTDGSGNTPLGKQLQAANLRSKDVQQKPDAELRKVIHDGQTNMPAFGDQLTDEEITQVIKYVRTLGKGARK
jgi:cytochrome c6